MLNITQLKQKNSPGFLSNDERIQFLCLGPESYKDNIIHQKRVRNYVSSAHKKTYESKIAKRKNYRACQDLYLSNEKVGLLKVFGKSFQQLEKLHITCDYFTQKLSLRFPKLKTLSIYCASQHDFPTKILKTILPSAPCLEFAKFKLFSYFSNMQKTIKCIMQYLSPHANLKEFSLIILSASRNYTQANYFSFEILSNMMLKLCRFQNLEKLKINCREPVLNSVQQELLGKLIVTNFRKLKDIDISLYLQDGPDSIEQLPYEESYAKFLDEIRNLPNLVSLTTTPLRKDISDPSNNVIFDMIAQMKNLTHLKLQLSDSCEHTFADLSSFQSCLMKLPKLQAFCFDCTNCILLINQYPYSTLTSSISQCKTLKHISIN